MLSVLEESAGLIAFVRTAETGSFSAAARSLGSTPSGVSKGVSRLEGFLGFKLFRRSTRLLMLTPEGEGFLDRIFPLLQQIDEVGTEYRSQTGAVGPLRASFPSELGHSLISSIFSEFLPRHPGIELELGLTDRQVNLVRDNYDVAFRVGSTDGKDPVVRTLARLEMVVVATPRFLDRHPLPSSVDELHRLPFARYVIDGQPYPIRFSDGTTMLPRRAVDLDSASAIRLAALAGVGAAHLMKCIVSDDIACGALVQIMPDVPLISLPFQAVHAFGRMTPSRVKMLCDFVANEIKRFVD